MQGWSPDAFNMVGRAFIEFAPRDNHGHFQFCCVDGFMDCEYGARDGKPCVEWSWEGADEADPVTGRGWANFGDDGLLRGCIFFHNGDNSEFVAEKSDC